MIDVKKAKKILLDEGEQYTDEQLLIIYEALKKMATIVTQISNSNEKK